MVREGIPFVGFGAAAALAGAGWMLWVPGPWPAVLLVVGVLLVGFMLYFFRDPEREVPDVPGAVVSPADGRILAINDAVMPLTPGGKGVEIAIFLSPLDVHVQRAPITGQISGIDRVEGKYAAAFSEQAGRWNTRCEVVVRSGHTAMVVRLIVGMMARRIVTWVQKMQEVVQGDRIGMIKFGSRVEIVVPAGMDLRVKVGDRVRAGETILGILPPPPKGRPRR
jgi:phosphatidylserine decarboxylase